MEETMTTDGDFFWFDPKTMPVHLPDGTSATDENLEAITDQLVIGAGARKRLKHLKPGGKSLSKDTDRSPQFKVTVSTDTANAVRQRAAAAHMSVSKWLRKVVEEKLAV
jgi:Flp pilus assembly protein TadG